MKALVFRAHGGPDTLTVADVPTPEPGSSEVRVRVAACALNHLDIWVRMGIPGLTIPLPHIPGSDVAGTVDKLGDGVGGWAPGDAVVVAPGLACGTCAACRAGDDHLCDAFDILGQVHPGGAAEYVCVPAANLICRPPHLTEVEAASLPLVFLTAWHMLVTLGRVQKGETVLVHAGGSGVGIAAIQIAKLRGARVLTTVGAPAKAAPARALGADEVILYRDVNFVDEAKRLTAGRGVDAVVDTIGADTFEKGLAALAKGGRLLICGATSGRQIQFDARALFGRNITVHGSRMGTRRGLLDAMDHVHAGRLKPVVDQVFPLAQAPEAHRRMEDRRNFGKIVLQIPQ
jgi:NADPH:quinone reductase-like Zn-dependent oxidoreductase